MYCWVLMMGEFFNGVNHFREQMRLNIRHELGVVRPETSPGSVPDRALRTARGSDAFDRSMTVNDTHVGLAHGNGGRFMRELIAEVFLRHLANPRSIPRRMRRAAWNSPNGEVMLTTDSFTVQPLEFPGRQDRLAGRARHCERSRGCRCEYRTT